MKKGLSIIAITVALIMSISFSIPVYATSRTTTGEVLGATRSLDQPGAQVLGATRNRVSGEGIVVGDITDKDALASLSNLEIFARLISAYTNKTVIAKELTILSSMDIETEKNIVVSEEQPLFVTFGFPAILKNSEVYVFHFVNGQWVIVPETISEGQVVGEFTSLSPVAIVAKTSTLNGSVLGANRSVSPRTGDGRYMIIAALVVVCGFFFTFRKKIFA